LYWSVLLALVIAFSNKTIETWLLNQTATAAQVGFFVIAATLTRGGVETVSSGLNTVLMPMMAHGYGEGGMDRVKSLLSDALRYFQFLGFVVAGVGYFIAEPSILLIYGEQYQPAVLAFQVMAVVAGVTMTEGVIGALLSTTDNQKLRAAFATVSLATSIIAAFILIPRYGLMGAVIAHGLSRIALLDIAMGHFGAPGYCRRAGQRSWRYCGLADSRRSGLGAGCAGVCSPLRIAGPLGWLLVSQGCARC